MAIHESNPPALLGSAAARRDFCLGVLATGLALASHACGGGSAAEPMEGPAPTLPITTTDTKAGLLATPDGTTRDYRNQGSFFLVKDATGIYAITAICTHLGCTVGVPVSGHFLCPCHGSQYDLGGANLVGPAVLPLAHLDVSEATPGGFLIVNPARPVAAAARLS
ncbi:MAG: Rieske 2Fe-2S domain-containing protein [Holophagaceae bacterium]